MKYGFHCILRWLCAAAVLCIGPVPVKAYIFESPGNPGQILVGVSFDSCPPGKAVNVAWTFWWVDQNGNRQAYQAGGTVLNSSGPNYQIAAIGTGWATDFPNAGGCEYVYLQVTIWPYNGDAVLSDTYTEVGANNIDNTYSDTMNFLTGQAPCGNATNNNTANYSLPITNITSTPEWLPNGQELLPGQGTNYFVSAPEGEPVTVTATSENPDNGADNVQDGGGYNMQFTNTTTPWTNWNWTTNNNPTIPVDGASATLLAGTNGGPILWDITNNSPAANSTLQAGFNALDETLLSGNNQADQNATNIEHALTNMNLVINMSGSNIFSGSSNVWVQNWPSNLYAGGSTNGQFYFTNAGTVSETGAVSSAVSQAFNNTNQAAVVVTPLASPVSSVEGLVPSTLGDNSGSAQEQDIVITPATAQQQVTIAFGVLPSNLMVTFGQIRGCIAWFVVVLLILWNFRSLFNTVKQVLTVPQGQGPDTGLWATAGGNIVTAVVVASAVVAVIATIPVLAVGLLAGELSFVSSYSTSSPLNFFSQMGWGFQYVAQFIPVYLLFAAFGVRIVFYFSLEMLAFFASVVIKLLVGV
jgi:hypothetical protein